MDTETSSKTYVFGNDGDKSGLGSGLIPGMIGGALTSGLGFGGFGGWGGLGGLNYGMNGIADLFGLAIIASMFGWNGGGFGNGGFGAGNSGAAFLANQLNNDSSRELIMQAVTSQGEASRTAIQNLATMIGQDFNLVNSGVQNVQNALSTMAIQNATTPLQIINQLQNGNSALASQLCDCCCSMKQLVTEQGFQSQLRTVEQTGAINNGFAAVNQNIAATKAAQELSDCKQSQLLVDNMNRNYQLLDNKIDALESSRKDREITALTAQVAKLESQNFTAGIVQQAVAPLNAAINGIAREVDDIKCAMPKTIPVQWPQIQAVNTTPYMGSFYGNGFYGNGWNNGINF